MQTRGTQRQGPKHDTPEGNAADSRYGGYGAVDYVYQIGKFEVTNAQWSEFLNAKAAVGDLSGLYNSYMAGTYGGIACSGKGTFANPYVYTAKGGDSNWDDRPVNCVSFWDAARFCNWLHNGQGDGDTESGAYINIGNQTTFARQPDAKWWIPSEDEWYKAAYYDTTKDGVGGYWDYPTGRNTVPNNQLVNPDPGNNANFQIGKFEDPNSHTIGAPYYATVVGEFENSDSPYGTFDQGGNLWEWNETAIGSFRGLRGGGWDRDSSALRAPYRGYDIHPRSEGVASALMGHSADEMSFEQAAAASDAAMAYEYGRHQNEQPALGRLASGWSCTPARRQVHQRHDLHVIEDMLAVNLLTAMRKP